MMRIVFLSEVNFWWPSFAKAVDRETSLTFW